MDWTESYSEQWALAQPHAQHDSDLFFSNMNPFAKLENCCMVSENTLFGLCHICKAWKLLHGVWEHIIWSHLQSLKIVAWCLRTHYLVSVTIAKLENCCMMSENTLFGLCHCVTPPKRNHTNKLEQIGTSTFLAARADYFLSKKIVYLIWMNESDRWKRLENHLPIANSS